MELPPVLIHLALKPSSLGGRGVFATKLFVPDELVEICPLLLLDRSVWGLSPTLDDHLVSVRSKLTPIALPLGYGALYNHADTPNAHWTADGDSSVMEVRAAERIMPGDEILIHYGKLFFEARRISPNTVVCPSSGDLRHFVGLREGGSGSLGG